jgi:hypothetical protein
MSDLIGDSRRIYCRFYNNTSGTPVLTDPSAVIYEVKINSGGTVTYTYGSSPEVIRESAGVYYLLLLFSAAGTYYVYCKGSGTVAAVEQITLNVKDKLT